MCNLSVNQDANKNTNATTVNKNPDEPKFTKVKIEYYGLWWYFLREKIIYQLLNNLKQ